MTDKLLNLIACKYPLESIDVGAMEKVKANGMTFTVEAFHAQGLGHVSVMRAKGFFGLMKMDTLIINPTVVDLPLYSYDRIYAAGNDTLIVELYDTLTEILAGVLTLKDHNLSERTKACIIDITCHIPIPSEATSIYSL